MIEESMSTHQRQRNLIKSLLMHASAEPVYLIPNIREFVFSEILNGAISYIGGQAGKFLYQNGRHFEQGNFEKYLFRQFNDELEKRKSPLSNETASELIELMRNSVERGDPRDGNYVACPFYDLFDGPFGIGLFSGYLSNRLRVPYEYISDAKKFLESIREKEKREITEIGRAMIPFMKIDLDYIVRYY